ncbi:MAG TPA: hypothetical protein VMV95_01300 [Bacillota bacterium]|nr:hypothetical protein [Bacillota bacterium]
MKKEIKEQCNKIVYGHLLWHSYQCQKKAVVKREGKFYCKIHDPEYIKIKEKKREEKYKKESCKCGHHFDRWWYKYCPLCGTKRV